MGRRNRSTLKHFFRKGALPSENQFGDLIDSMLNMIDEGFYKSPENGWEISSLGDHGSLISFSRNNDPTHPVWTISYDPSKTKLLILNKDKKEKSVLSLGPDGRVGVNKQEPQSQLDVNGVVTSTGRLGAYQQGFVPADGKWHRITDALYGCQAFEVIAGAGKKKTGMYALMHAFAVNTFNPKGLFFNFLNLKKRIRYHQAYYRSLSNKLKLRWVGENRSYYLELKSNGDYGKGIRIKYSITNLWFDEDMSESWSDADNQVTSKGQG